MCIFWTYLFSFVIVPVKVSSYRVLRTSILIFFRTILEWMGVRHHKFVHVQLMNRNIHSFYNRLSKQFNYFVCLPNRPAKYITFSSQSESDIHVNLVQFTIHNANDAFLILNHTSQLPALEDLACILRDCIEKKIINGAWKLYILILGFGLEFSSIIWEYLLLIFLDSESISDVQCIFRRMCYTYVQNQENLIHVLVKHGLFREAIAILQSSDIYYTCSNKYLYQNLLKVCNFREYVSNGQILHTEIVKKGFDIDYYVGSTLLDMYGKNGMLEEAEVVFDGLLTKDVVTWTALICGYVGSGHGEKAIQFLFKMSEEGITPNSVTFICGLKACRLLGDIDKCRQIHTDLVKGGYEVDIRILSSLIGMYTSCNQFEETQVVFDKAFVKDVVLWTALIGGYAETGNSKEALTWLERMQTEGFLPNPATFVCGLKACCNLGSSEEVQRLHINLIKSGFEGDSLLITSLMNAYSKCGFLSEAQHIFDEVEIKSLPIWNTLIGGYIDHECGQEALDNFRRMQVERVPPDSITLVYALKACIISKLMQNGQCLQIETTKFGFDRDYFVGIQLLDMYSKFGLVEEAQHVFERLPTWDVVSYNAFIMGFAEHGFGEEALQCLSRMHEEGVSMDAITAVCGLKACISLGLIRIGRWIHGQILKQDLIEHDPIIGILLIDIYVKCKYLLEAQKVFYGMTNKSLIAWSTLLMGYAFSGEWELVFSLLGEMQSCGMPLDTICLLSALTVCSHSGLIEEGVRVFGILGKEYAIPSNLEHFNSMIDLFCRAGQIEKASGMLDVIPFQPNFVTWTTLLGACRQCGDIQVSKQAFNHAAVLTGNKVDLLISTLGIYEDNCWFLRQAVGSESSAEVGIVPARAVCH